MRILIKRIDFQEVQTLGVGMVLSGTDVKFIFKTLELPWKEKQISCIPTGIYKVVRRKSDKFGDHFHILNVPGRDLILIHPANYVKQLKGCIAVGHAFQDLDGDKVLDITDSRAAMMKLNSLLNAGIELEIV
jgi:hypothetical protein